VYHYHFVCYEVYIDFITIETSWRLTARSYSITMELPHLEHVTTCNGSSKTCRMSLLAGVAQSLLFEGSDYVSSNVGVIGSVISSVIDSVIGSVIGG
jgi:hypothetical protein